jgi:propanol-preferring alcohol dehydrogenase
VRALRLISWQSDPVVVDDAPMPLAGAGQVVIKVVAAGACHSDLHIMYDYPAGMFPWGPPITIGHENTGTVHQVGEGVTGWHVGDRVAVHGPWGCGHCEACADGADNYCAHPFHADNSAIGGGIGLDGGMAEYLLVPDPRHLVRVPDELDLVAAAPLTDAGLTPYHAVKLSLPKLTPGSHAVVIGVGGLGHMGIQLLSALSGTTIVALDTRPEALELATACGAHHTVLASGDDVGAETKEITKGRGAEVVLDFVGIDQTIALGASLGRIRGDVTIVGAAGGTFGMGIYTAPYEMNLRSTMWGTRPELSEVLTLAALGKITPIYETYSLSGSVQAYKQLHANAVRGRAVVVPDSPSGNSP